MNDQLSSNSPVTIDECRYAGGSFGRSRRHLCRIAFERELLERLTALEETFSHMLIDRNAALAGFDQAAWGAWDGAGS